MVAVAHLVKASDEDLANLYPDREPGAAVDHLLALGPAAVVVTRGGDGATWVTTQGSVEIASLPVEVADTIGAGDTFGAAMLDALWDLDMLGGRIAALDASTIETVLRRAAAAAAVTVSRPGADPPYRHELL
jgi:fructokinase